MCFCVIGLDASHPVYAVNSEVGDVPIFLYEVWDSLPEFVLGSSYLIDVYGHYFYRMDWRDHFRLPREALVPFPCVLQSLLVRRIRNRDLEVSTGESFGCNRFVEASFF